MFIWNVNGYFTPFYLIGKSFVQMIKCMPSIMDNSQDIHTYISGEKREKPRKKK